MNIYAISDLHLEGNQNKPMNIFGKGWDNHFEKIVENWQQVVQEEDIVLIAGDISWAMAFEDGISDIEKIAKLKGKKIFIRGNHDYWWNKISTLREVFKDKNCYFLQNDCIKFGEYIFCGCRGWLVPENENVQSEQDKKIYCRELERFKLAFKAVKKLRQPHDKVICLVHYPPFNNTQQDSAFTKMFEENHVNAVIYGHIHQYLNGYFLKSIKNNIPYYLTACDLLDFHLKKIV